ncbi:beta-ketoacyl synthase chain length factor [Zoogloea sp.]|uniref:beta-ketoacyl synthase chain length factor n=1 Tax=Zoogloea sp. TaxID=49181 RepID=UPI00322064F3
MSAPVSLSAWIEGVGLIAPGLPDWAHGAAVLAGREAHLPAPSVLPAPMVLPPNERRRASRVVRVALASGLAALEQAGMAPSGVAAVFAASTADGHNCHALCETLASSDQRVSPTRFHNSLHNTPAGYWSIATGAMAASQSLCASDASFAAGLIETLVQIHATNAPCVLIAYDAEYPEPLASLRPIPDAAGISVALGPRPSPRSLARLDIRLGDGAATRLGTPSLETLRTAIPALRGLPLLEALASARGGELNLEYLAPLSLHLTLSPC